MNYKHAYHAGNHADVLKHLVLLATLDALSVKPAPWFLLDTHAGQGRYALDSVEAGKTGESAEGITRLQRWGAAHRPLKAALARYLKAVRPHTDAGFYPGSPLLAAEAAREDDRIACCELQADQCAPLKALFARDPRVGVHQRDGYTATKALLPPSQRRGLVLIDPPYEAQAAEFDTVLDAIRTGLGRWPQGIFALWYPIKQRRTLLPFFRRVAHLPARNIWTAELLMRPDDSPLRMNGSGMLLVNPPWQLDQAIEPVLPDLAAAMGDAGARWQLHWLAREAS